METSSLEQYTNPKDKNNGHSNLSGAEVLYYAPAGEMHGTGKPTLRSWIMLIIIRLYEYV